MSVSEPRKGLGRGLGALIGANEKTMEAANQAGVLEIDLTHIEPNPSQPRKYFDDVSIQELADSIRVFGVIQPLILKKTDNYYTIVAGERRWRAARLAGLRSLPAIIKDYTDAQVLQVALIENIQRRDLNPIEEALCYKRLVDEFFFTQEEIAGKLGKSRNTISYALGLLLLDPRVQNMLVEGLLTPGHARFLAQVRNTDNQARLAQHIVEQSLTTRQTQELVKQAGEAMAEPSEADASQASKPKSGQEGLGLHYTALEKDLKTILGAQVNIKYGKNKGRIEIEYYSPDELDRLLGLFKGLNP